jgi:hypothetical protein
MNRLIILTASAILFVMASCDPVVPVPTQKEKSTDLVVPAGFNWKTTQVVKVTVTGLSLPADFFSTLRMYDPEGNLLYTCNYNLRENLSFNLTVPGTTTELSLNYGRKTLKSAITNGTAGFSFMVN